MEPNRYMALEVRAWQPNGQAIDGSPGLAYPPGYAGCLPRAFRELPASKLAVDDRGGIVMTADKGTGTSVVCLVMPMLSVRNGLRAIAFYKSAFGAIEVYHVEDPTGSVVSRLSVAGAEFWLSDESPEHGNFSPESLGGSSARIILTVSDPDAVFAKALAAGAREVYPVAEAHGWRIGRVVDPFGHHWEIGRPLAV